MSLFSSKKTKKIKIKGVLKNPFFYFVLLSLILLNLLFSKSDSLAKLSYFEYNGAALLHSFLDAKEGAKDEDLFSNKNDVIAPETPDLKILQEGFLYGVSTPLVLSPKTLGDIFGGAEGNRNTVTDYLVQPGDTVESIAKAFNISKETLLWANHLSSSVSLKSGQTLVILPVSGVIHEVKSGDTISEVAKTYKVATDDIVAFNGLTSPGDIFIGDILIVPGGIMPRNPSPAAQASLADSFFIYPAEGRISQGLHYYNGVDVSNNCGTPVYAAASGVVQRVIANGGWNFGMGNYATILHSGNVSTYYGHLSAVFVVPGSAVNVGDKIGLVGRTGNATGCHVHFQVMGAKNPLAKYLVGTVIKYK